MLNIPELADRGEPSKMSPAMKETQRVVLGAFFGVDESEFQGERFGDVLKDAERAGAVVYWGCWTTADLDERL